MLGEILKYKKGAWLLTRVSQLKAVINIVLCVSSQWKVEFYIPFLCCRVKEPLVSFDFSEKNTLVFPPHSAPFITGWSRQTYSSYISCKCSGRHPRFRINYKRAKMNYFLTLCSMCNGPAEWVFSNMYFWLWSHASPPRWKGSWGDVRVRVNPAPSKPCGGSGSCLLQI